MRLDQPTTTSTPQNTSYHQTPSLLPSSTMRNIYHVLFMTSTPSRCRQIHGSDETHLKIMICIFHQHPMKTALSLLQLFPGLPTPVRFLTVTFNSSIPRYLQHHPSYFNTLFSLLCTYVRSHYTLQLAGLWLVSSDKISGACIRLTTCCTLFGREILAVLGTGFTIHYDWIGREGGLTLIWFERWVEVVRCIFFCFDLQCVRRMARKGEEKDKSSLQCAKLPNFSPI